MRQLAIVVILLLVRSQLLAGELHDAVSSGDRAKVEQLLAGGADVNEMTYNDFRPLHLARDPAIVEVLLRFKPKLDVVSVYGTPLQGATEEVARKTTPANSWKRIVDLLLKAGAEYDIISAIHLDDLARVQAILKTHPEAVMGRAFRPFTPETNGSPLRVAASEGHDEICSVLLEHNADPEDIDRGCGFSILEAAVKYPKIVKQLIEAGADVNQRLTWNCGRTGYWPIGDDATVLHFAALHGVPETVTMLIDRGVDIYASAHDTIDQSKKQTALDVAAMFGKAKNAEAIVNHAKFKRADHKRRQEALDHALVLGASFGRRPNKARLALVELLLKNGADPNAQEDGTSAVQLAAVAIRPKADKENAIVKQAMATLVRQGARLDFFSAVAIGDEATAGQLLQQDPRIVNGRGPEGYPALNVAVGMDYKNVVKLLLDANCDVNIVNNSWHTGYPGETPLHCAASWGRVELANRLIAAGAEVIARDQDKSTPLHAAAASGDIEIAGLLIDHGAQVDAKDVDGLTPMDYWQSPSPNLDKEFEKLLDAHSRTTN